MSKLLTGLAFSVIAPITFIAWVMGGWFLIRIGALRDEPTYNLDSLD